jgi:hypothetical protein
MRIEMIVTKGITVAGANRSTVARMTRDREEGAPVRVFATKAKDIPVKTDGAARAAAVLLPAEAATTKAAAGRTEVGRATAITPAIAIAATGPMVKIITRVPATTDRIGVVTMARARAGTGRDRVVTTAKAPAGMERV